MCRKKKYQENGSSSIDDDDEIDYYRDFAITVSVLGCCLLLQPVGDHHRASEARSAMKALSPGPDDDKAFVGQSDFADPQWIGE